MSYHTWLAGEIEVIPPLTPEQTEACPLGALVWRHEDGQTFLDAPDDSVRRPAGAGPDLDLVWATFGKSHRFDGAIRGDGEDSEDLWCARIAPDGSGVEVVHAEWPQWPSERELLEEFARVGLHLNAARRRMADARDRYEDARDRYEAELRMIGSLESRGHELLRILRKREER